VRAPVNSFEFQPCGRTSQAEDLSRLLRYREVPLPTSSPHRLQRGLPGYLILFATHALAPQRQYQARWLPSPSTFLPISTHFTATPEIPPPSLLLQFSRLRCSSQVKPGAFTSHSLNRLRALYAQLIRLTLAPSVLPRLLAQSLPVLILPVPSICMPYQHPHFFPT